MEWSWNGRWWSENGLKWSEMVRTRSGNDHETTWNGLRWRGNGLKRLIDGEKWSWVGPKEIPFRMACGYEWGREISGKCPGIGLKWRGNVEQMVEKWPVTVLDVVKMCLGWRKNGLRLVEIVGGLSRASRLNGRWLKANGWWTVKIVVEWVGNGMKWSSNWKRHAMVAKWSGNGLKWEELSNVTSIQGCLCDCPNDVIVKNKVKNVFGRIRKL